MNCFVNEYDSLVFMLHIFPHKIMGQRIFSAIKCGAFVMNEANSWASAIRNEIKFIDSHAWVAFNKLWPKHYFEGMLVFVIGYDFLGFPIPS